jgi:glycosyltransferase-like protein
MTAKVLPISYRIAFLTYSTKPRGSVIHTLELAEALHQLGHQVCVYALTKDGQGFDYSLSCQSVLIPANPAPAELDALIQQRIQEFIDYFKSTNPSFNIYHAQDCISANALLTLRQLGKIPHFVRTVHHIEDYSSPYLRDCQERSIREADLCLCVSQHWQTELRQHYNIAAPRVLNGVNLARFSANSSDLEAQIQQQWRLIGKSIFLTVGGIEPRKNSIRLLQAFAQVKSHHPTAQLVIAGGATLFDYQTYRDEFWTIAQQLNLAIDQDLVLAGVLSSAELAALYRVADAFVFPSLKEGWGLVILEAIAAGLPVITANQPPFTEFLDQTQALLVDPYSVPAIAQAMQAILQPDRATSLVQRSQSVLTHYNWESSANLHLQQYEQLCNLKTA